MINPPQAMPAPGQQSDAQAAIQGQPQGASLQQPPMPQPDPNQAQKDAETSFMLKVKAAILNKNLVESWDEDDERLTKMAECVIAGYDIDERSRSGWIEQNQAWLRLALMLRDSKVWPWVGASNVKYPLLTTAAMQFSARAYPTLVPADNLIVKAKVVGYDQDGTRFERADRIAKHMSWQIMYKIPNWEEDMDRLLMLASIVGVVFKETYYDSKTKQLCSHLVYPEDLVVNYGATSLDDAYRITKIIYVTNLKYEEKRRSGEYRDIGDLGFARLPDVPSEVRPRQDGDTRIAVNDEATPHIFLACHTFYDVDDDGYPEPVTIVVHKETRKVVRVVARFSLDNVTFDDAKKKVIAINPINYFTDFPFIPNPDGSIYALGFGALLGPMNETVNSLINQLVDAGTLNNMQTGFIGKGLRLQMKEIKMRPGQWQTVNATGDDLKKSIFPLPSKEPSDVLFKLMQSLIQAGNQLASVAEIFVGKMPGQNTPATTTQETVDQAMKVFTAIYKRIYRALQREFQKIYLWNSLNPAMVEEEARVLGIPLQSSDYEGDPDDVIPSADPTGSSATVQAQQLATIGQQLLPLGVINAQEFAMRQLKLVNIADPEKLIAPPQPPQPDPKVQTEQLKQQTIQQQAQADQQTQQQDFMIKKQLAELEMQKTQMELAFKEQNLKMDRAAKQQEMQLEMQAQKLQMILDQHKAQFDLAHSVRTSNLEYQQQKQAGSQKLQQGEAAFRQKQQQAKITQKNAKRK